MLGISFLVLMVLSLVAMAPGPPAALRGGMDLFSAMFYVFIALLALTLASYLVTLPILPVMGPLVHDFFEHDLINDIAGAQGEEGL